MREDAFELDRLIGRQIRHLRSLRGRSLMAVADEIGVSYQQLQKYETGSNRLSVARLCQIARTLDIDPVQIIETLPKHVFRRDSIQEGDNGSQCSCTEGQRLREAYFALPAETRRVMLRLMEAVSQGGKTPSGTDANSTQL